MTKYLWHHDYLCPGCGARLRPCILVPLDYFCPSCKLTVPVEATIKKEVYKHLVRKRVRPWWAKLFRLDVTVTRCYWEEHQER